MRRKDSFMMLPFIARLLFSSLVLLVALPNKSVGQERPNIVLIMADDMGFSDIGCYGGEIPTPNLDQLAANGLRFSQFYNVGRCCPSRASLLTGLAPHQAGIGHMAEDPEKPKVNDWGVHGYRGYLNRNSVTLAEVLKQAGYHT
ncbi:MAG: sulfatase-like hydrolase/transferase, partial [Rufibacter sp.]